jgi:hypothetical protein
MVVIKSCLSFCFGATSITWNFKDIAVWGIHLVA